MSFDVICLKGEITALVQNSGKYKKYAKNMWLCIMAMKLPEKKQNKIFQ